MSARPTDVTVSGALWGAFRACSERRIADRHPMGNHAYRPGPVASPWRGVTVFMASAFAPYASSCRAGRVTVHRVRAVYIAWRRGRVVGRLVVVWCGHGLVTATLTDDPGCAHEMCRSCWSRVGESRCCHEKGCCA